jgi:DNA sulfur modification protein DndD
MCYSGVHTIEIGEHLTLIIGANGDGKTKFFEALEWLFDTTNKTMDSKYVSKHRFSELRDGESDSVSVSITYQYNTNESGVSPSRCLRTFEKSFRFSRSISNEINVSGFSYKLITDTGAERTFLENQYAIKEFDENDFKYAIRKYSLFKGEQELNIFNQPEAMKSLISTFSNIKDFDTYIDFMDFAKYTAQKATESAMKSDKKNCKEAEHLQNLIIGEERKLGDLMADLRNKQSEATNFTDLLNNLENSKEASQLFVATKQRLESLNADLQQTHRELNENYTFRLLDDMWILMGFESIAEEYRVKVGALDKEQRRLEREFQREQGAKKLANEFQAEINQGFVPLALNVPDENTMREMLNEHVCKVCGTPAPEGSLPYNTMKKHLDDYLESIKEASKEEDEVTLFVKEYIKELTDKYTVLHQSKSKLANIKNYISESIEQNRKLHNKIETLQANIEAEEETKRKILAQADGLTEDQLVSKLEDINQWWRLRTDAERSAEVLKKQIDIHKRDLDDFRQRYEEISKDSSASTFSRSSVAIRKIYEAFVSAKERNKEQFLGQLSGVTNSYLGKLNKYDFTGTVKIAPKGEDSAELILQDKDEAKIYNPNTALKTTMYMSMLFAIAELAAKNETDGYPMLFDAPTSSFTMAKESDFFKIISGINRQTIIVTKSFLNEDKDGHSVLDSSKIQGIKGKIYRIEKKTPFDEKDLSTIQTTITPIVK